MCILVYFMAFDSFLFQTLRRKDTEVSFLLFCTLPPQSLAPVTKYINVIMHSQMVFILFFTFVCIYMDPRVVCRLFLSDDFIFVTAAHFREQSRSVAFSLCSKYVMIGYY